MLSIIKNLTGETAKAVDRLVQENAFHRAILESSVDFAIITADLNGIVTSWNVGAQNVLGWAEAEMIGEPAGRFFTPEDTARGFPEREMKACLENGRAEDERWHLRKDHTRFWANGLMMPLRTLEGQHIGYLKILRDRTDQRKIQDDLHESQTRTALALDSASIGIWETDLDLGHVIWDARARQLFDITADEALNYEMSFLQRIHAQDRERVHKKLSEVIAGFGDIFEEEFRIFAATESQQRWVHATGRVIDRRDTKCMMGTMRDVTRQKEAELRQQLLTGELEHRIKNTLAMVQGIVSQSLRNATSPQAATAAITQRLVSLGKAHDLLTKNSWSSSSLTELVKGATQFQGAVEGRVHITGSDILVGAKSALGLTLVLHELCTNAIKYGALSNEVGHVNINWSIAGDGDESLFDFTWQEFNGPQVIAVKKKGFGLRLIENSMGKVENTSATLTFDSAGVIWIFSTPLSLLKADD